MTADRWWVRTAARWLARIDGVSGHIRLAMLGLTGVSTATLTLQQYGHGEYARPFVAVTGVLTLAFTYYYTEGGVWNQMARDRQDLSRNYATPSMLMGQTMIGISAFVAINEREPTEQEREMIEEAVRDQWEGYRDGVTLPEEEHE